MSILTDAIVTVRKAFLADSVIKKHCPPDHVVPLYMLESDHAADGSTMDVSDYIVMSHEGLTIDDNKFGVYNETYHMLVNVVSTDYDSSLEMAEAVRRVLLHLQNTSSRNIALTDFRGEPAEFNGRLRYVQIIRYDFGEINPI